MKYYSLPADFKTETLDCYLSLNEKYQDSKVQETYGNITLGNIYGSGRSADTLPELDKEKLRQYVRYSLDHGIKFDYTLNAPSLKNLELTKSGLEKIKEFLKSICDIGIDSMTVSMPSLMEIVKMLAPEIHIKASAISSINTPNKALAYKEFGADRIVVEEAVNRDFGTLKNIVKAFGENVEVITNVVCYRNCIYRQFHYNSYIFDSIEYGSNYKYYITRCSQRMLNNPSVFLKNSWIRPEDINEYEKIGINHFKIQGRDVIKSANPAKAVEHYFMENFDGNLWELIMLFDKNFIPSVYIDNKKLDGFIRPFVDHEGFCKNMCDSCGYCDSFVDKAMDVSKIDRFRNYVNSGKYDKFSNDLLHLQEHTKE